MKIGLISDSPTCTTGFARTTFHIAEALTIAKHEVVCFGFKAIGQTFNPADYPYKIWTVGTKWQGVMPLYLAYEKFDVLFFNMDIYNLKEVMNECRQCGWNGPSVCYVVFDSLPVSDEYLAVLKHLKAFSTSTATGAAYLKSLGIREVLVGPSGVDTKIFRPLTQREALKAYAGLSDHFVIGVFGRNCERKQQVRVLQAIHHLQMTNEHMGIFVYFHCTSKGYWDLDEIARNLGIRELVLFDTTLSDETAGVPYASDDELPASFNGPARMPAEFSYVQRLNCCDLVLNVPHSGDFEQVIIEAQACGVPLAHTNDSGIMAEAMGEGGILLEPGDVTYGQIGQKLYFVAPEKIALTIKQIRANAALREDLVRKGLANAEKYPWLLLGKTAVETVAQLQSMQEAKIAVYE